MVCPLFSQSLGATATVGKWITLTSLVLVGLGSPLTQRGRGGAGDNLPDIVPPLCLIIIHFVN